MRGVLTRTLDKPDLVWEGSANQSLDGRFCVRMSETASGHAEIPIWVLCPACKCRPIGTAGSKWRGYQCRRVRWLWAYAPLRRVCDIQYRSGSDWPRNQSDRLPKRTFLIAFSGLIILDPPVASVQSSCRYDR